MKRRKEKGTSSSSSAHFCLSSSPFESSLLPLSSADPSVSLPLSYHALLPFLRTPAISKTFCFDLLIDPKGRGVVDVSHEIVAVGSRSVEKANMFIEDNGLRGQATGFGSYQEVYDDPVSLCEAE